MHISFYRCSAKDPTTMTRFINEQHTYNHSCPLWLNKSNIMEDTRPRLHTCQACIPHVISSLCNWNARTFHCTTGIITPCLSQWVIKQEQQATVTRLGKKNSGGSHMQQYSIWISSVPILIFHDLNLLDNKPLHFKSMYYISLDSLCIYGYINPSRTLNSFHCMRTIKTACKL